MTHEQKRAAIVERYERLKARVTDALERCRSGQESIENATLAVLDLGRFTLEATTELMELKGAA